jgi:hypothetical protein
MKTRQDQLAFPGPILGADGMTLRQFYAGQFLAGLASNNTLMGAVMKEAGGPPENGRKELARSILRVVDALIEVEAEKQG